MAARIVLNGQLQWHSHSFPPVVASRLDDTVHFLATRHCATFFPSSIRAQRSLRGREEAVGREAVPKRSSVDAGDPVRFASALGFRSARGIELDTERNGVAQSALKAFDAQCALGVWAVGGRP